MTAKEGKESYGLFWKNIQDIINFSKIKLDEINRIYENFFNQFNPVYPVKKWLGKLHKKNKNSYAINLKNIPTQEYTFIFPFAGKNAAIAIFIP